MSKKISKISLTGMGKKGILSIAPKICRNFICAQIAQMVEQRTENPRVGGSIPSLGIRPACESTRV